jgi:hypothetical protein
VTIYTVTTAKRDDVYNFRRGMPLRMTDSGGLVPLTRSERAAAWFKRTWERWTRWWRPRSVVSAIDAAEGRITIVTETWSWRRWRWESETPEDEAAQPPGVPPDVPSRRRP